MNKYILVLFFSLIALQCKSQKLNPENMNTIVTPEFKRFDYKKIEDLKEKYNSNINLSSVRKDSTADFKFTKEYKDYQLLEYDKNGNLHQKTILKEDNSVEIYQKLTPFLDYYERYFSDGNIAVKGITSWLGFGIGKQYIFTKDGKIRNKKDFDEGFKFTFNDLLNYCNENEIDLASECEFPHRVVKTQDNSNKKYWIIEYCNSRLGRIDSFKIDGETGKVILKHSENFPRKGVIDKTNE
ncbi:hypothetical protein NU10_11160 [Flavobacterium dauae]|uniref:hypothetical protein n=1 Tax=Flavobacterium dauae TaxID=1563479 RepID=UPI00101B2E5D|nr:hypothetical protein [Flavobacterium dauae]WLD23261.1 hypothetical protein NU10_11160 [Flavobacterium dauae]